MPRTSKLGRVVRTVYILDVTVRTDTKKPEVCMCCRSCGYLSWMTERGQPVDCGFWFCHLFGSVVKVKNMCSGCCYHIEEWY